jgi:hypothetical protein
MARKDGGPVLSIFQGSSDGIKKRVVVLGKPECGKSQTLHILQNPEAPLDTSVEYTPTNGTTSVQVDIPPMTYTFTEVGGGLIEFWTRSIDSKTDGIWYMISKEDYDQSQFTALETFLVDARDILLKRKPAFVISVLGVDESASTSEIEILVNATGSIDPKKLAVIHLADPASYASILKSIDGLKSKLIQE